MNRQECQRSGARRGLLPFLLATLALLLVASACSDPEKAKAEHLNRGEAYLKEKKYQEASLEFRNAVQIDDRAAQAHWGLARAYEGAGQFAQAVDEMQRTIQLDPNNLDARVRLGNYYIVAYQQNRDSRTKDEASRLAEEVLQKNPNHIEGHILRGTILFTAGDKEGALAELKKAVEIDPRRVESLISLALYYRQTGDSARAEETYQRAIGVDDRSALAHLEYARFFVQQNRMDRAEEQFLRAVEVDQQNREAHRTLVTFYIQQKRLDRAEQAARALAQLDSGKPEGTAVLGDFYSQIGRPEEAARAFQETIAKFPDYTQARYRLGELMMQKGDAAGALAQAEGVLKKNANDKQALLLRARVRMNGGAQLRDAVEDLKQVLKQEPRDQAGLYYMADAHLRLNQIEQARVFAGDLEKYYPNEIHPKLLQLQINLAAGDWQAALRQSNDLVEKLSRATPDSRVTPEMMNELRAKALTARGSAQAQLKNLAAARADFTAARDLLPNAPSSHTNLAAVAAVEKKRDEAMQHYERALQLDATSFDALNGIIGLFAQQKEFDKAHARVDQALAVKDSAPLHFLKGQIYGAQGGAAKEQKNQELEAQFARGAEGEMRRALELDPNFVPAFNAIASLYINTDQPDQAIASLREWAAKRPDDAVPHVMIGMIEDKRQSYDKANESYRKALTIRPDHIFAANNLAWNYADHGGGNLDEAMRLAQGVVQKFPDEPGFADTLGWVYFKKGLGSAAVEQLQKAVSRAQASGGDNAAYRARLGQALAAAGRKAEARQQLQQALNTGAGKGLTPAQAEEARRALATL
ncbi:MAG: tetratricopeptide repeat protein [Acidobacteria bacterium]|nr:tetratricopeptide repeat protein [Acidobacteriota bacterium]MCA1641380.1 tetratricopeptide repeat protein [Acidobacteriota bacterium]